MRIEIYEMAKSECRIYEIEDGCSRILVDKTRKAGEVWGFIDTDNPDYPHQVNGQLISKKNNVMIKAENEPTF